MADWELLAEAIAAQRAYDEAAAEVHECVRLLPTGADAAAGKVALSEGPWVALAQA